ncbi:alkaline phosphatase D family protein [Halogeometricum sp. S1BR25-6]|uniref:Alkaline phosphatase D family protein n=1 Tax=Halogeometricum salsisoli TaxID=2950536 RepID=A0ABU2GIL3_9EURY|nr:alkaline phosphatase D family protein [Halogeometricum sp. S1BR25-6]MDS0300672.1 alkaline phosphatase D family protein [Halogeometricum sp. S1BR25-6]
MSGKVTRRGLLATVGTATATATLGEGAVGTVEATTETPESETEADSDEEVPEKPVPRAVQSGDVKSDRAIIWSRTDAPARMYVEVATDEYFSDVRTVRGPAALSVTDYAAKLDLRGLPSGEEIHYRVVFESLEHPAIRSDPVSGQFRTPAEGEQDVRFVWGGDVVGQGWGIDRDRGGMTIFEAMRELDPDLFIHSGDAVYADGPLPETVELDDGGVWNNVVTEAKSEVADALSEFRGNYRYNFIDDHYRNFLAEVPMIPQWDDHEVTNNYYLGEMLPEDDPHDVESVNLLAARGQRAFVEYMPIRTQESGWNEHYDSFEYGSTMEVFRLDLRSYRGPNTATRNEEESEATAVLGEEQLAWLKESLAASEATWKVIASDMPIGLVVTDGDYFEAIGNVDGEPVGREHEIADLLSFLNEEDVRNVVWFTADVHYTAAHHYHPDRAQFTDFNPFREFVTGPLHAGTFGPSALDDTFGPEVAYEKSPPEGEANLPPSEGLQFFGQVDVAADSEEMTVTLRDRDGDELYSETLVPGAYGHADGGDDESDDEADAATESEGEDDETATETESDGEGPAHTAEG